MHKSRYHGMDVVVKKLLPTVNEADRQVALKLLSNEVRQLSKLRHKNIVQLIGICVDPMMLVLDYAEHGNLREYISRNPSIPMRDKLDMLAGVARGMALLHKRGILHLDLKPENVLVGRDHVVWISDFGLAKAKTTMTSMGGASTGGGTRGTLQYKAPELFKSKKLGGVVYDKPADVYSFSMLCWGVFAGTTPFGEKTETDIPTMHIMALLGHEDPERPDIGAVPSGCQAMVSQCWSQEPTERPGFEEIEAQLMTSIKGLAEATDARNDPGHWDVFLGHSRRSADAVLLAREAATSLRALGFSVWLDVDMTDKSLAAMEEGVKCSKYFLAVITGPCVNNDRPGDPPRENAYFRRAFCIQELMWAKEAGKFIQPIVRQEDKGRIGEFLGLLQTPLEMSGVATDISHFGSLGQVDWIDLNRNHAKYWDVGVEFICEAFAKADKAAQRKRAAHPGVAVGDKPPKHASSTTEKELAERLEKISAQEKSSPHRGNKWRPRRRR